IALCQDLIQSPSLSGQEQEVANKIQSFAKEHKFDEITVDRFGNVAVVINGLETGPTVLFDGHIDTVPVFEENWTVNPYDAIVRDGKIWGRGTSDMKGSVTAMLLAAK